MFDLCFHPYAREGCVLTPFIDERFWCKTMPTGMYVSTSPLKYGVPWACI